MAWHGPRSKKQLRKFTAQRKANARAPQPAPRPQGRTVFSPGRVNRSVPTKQVVRKQAAAKHAERKAQAKQPGRARAPIFPVVKHQTPAQAQYIANRTARYLDKSAGKDPVARSREAARLIKHERLETSIPILQALHEHGRAFEKDVYSGGGTGRAKYRIGTKNIITNQVTPEHERSATGSVGSGRGQVKSLLPKDFGRPSSGDHLSDYIRKAAQAAAKTSVARGAASAAKAGAKLAGAEAKVVKPILDSTLLDRSPHTAAEGAGLSVDPRKNAKKAAGAALAADRALPAYLHKVSGAPESARLAYETLLDPLNFVPVGGEAGAALKGLSKVNRLEKALNAMGHDALALRGVKSEFNQALRTGDARPVASILEAKLKQAQRVQKAKPKINFAGTRSQRVAAAAEDAPTTNYVTAVQGRRRSRKARKLTEDEIRPGRRMNPAAAQDAAIGSLTDALKEATRPGVNVGLRHPFAVRGHDRGQRLSFNIPLSRGGNSTRSLRGLKVPFNEARNTALDQAWIRTETEKIHRQHAPEIQRLRKALADAEGPAAEKAALSALRTEERKITNLVTQRVGGEIPTDATIPAKELFAVRNESRGMKRLMKSTENASRHTVSAIGHNMELAIAPLKNAGFRGDEFRRALTRVDFRLKQKEGNDIGEILPHVFEKGSVKQRAEEATEANLRALYDELASHGVNHGILRGRRAAYAGTRHYKGSPEIQTANELLDGMIGGGTGKFAAGRHHANAFAISARSSISRDLADAFGFRPEDAQRWADALHQGDESRFNAEMMARRLQRNGNEGIPGKELTPAEIRALQEWGPEAPNDANKLLTVREGNVHLNLPTDRDASKVPGEAQRTTARHFGDELTDEEKIDHIKADYAAHEHYFGERLYNEAAPNTDLAHYDRAMMRLNDELHTLEPVDTSGAVEQISPEHNRLTRMLDIQEGGASIQRMKLTGLKEALRSVHPRLLELRDGSRRDLRLRVTYEPKRRTLGSYVPETHEIEINAAHSAVNSTKPEDVAQVRSTLIHELAHARTINKQDAGQSLALANRAASRNYQNIAEQQLVEEDKITDLDKLTDDEMDARTEADSGPRDAAIEQRAAELKREAVNAEIGPVFVENFGRLRETLDDFVTKIRANPPPTNETLAGTLSRRFEEKAREITELHSDPGYFRARNMWGPEMVVAEETSARAMEMLALDADRFRSLVGDELADWMTDDILRVQAGDLLPVADAPNEHVMRDDGQLMVRGRGGPTPVPVGDSVPLGGVEQALPDPPHTPGQNDDPFDVMSRLPDLRSEEMHLALDPRADITGRAPSQARAEAAQAMFRAIDSQWGRSRNDPSLVALGKDRGGTIYHDSVTGEDFIQPVIRDPAGELKIGGVTLDPDRVWPSRQVTNLNYVLTKAGAFDRNSRTGAGALYNDIMARMRFSVTTPFPAYHLRNMASDLIMSLQADSGVIFHPIVNGLAASGPLRGAASSKMIKVPGIGEMKMADYLLMADLHGVRSAEHLVDFAEYSKVGTSGLTKWLMNTSAKREDMIRMATFHQRLRRNGGDAADAAAFMMRTHFDYSDLSQAERRIARNTFLFYTWYRKNIPHQLAEIARRPAFFTAVGNSYFELEHGGTPLGKASLPPFRPDYISDRLMAVPMNWGGHSIFVGFGAPWGDLNWLTPGGERNLPSSVNPLLQFFSKVVPGFVSPNARFNYLTGQQYGDKTPGWLASAFHAIPGNPFNVGVDRKGHPILPWWLSEASNVFPGPGRLAGSISGKPTSLAGLTVIDEPGPHTKGWTKARGKAYFGLLMELGNKQRSLYTATRNDQELYNKLKDYENNVWLPKARAMGFDDAWVKKTQPKGQMVGHPLHYQTKNPRKKFIFVKGKKVYLKSPGKGDGFGGGDGGGGGGGFGTEGGGL